MSNEHKIIMLGGRRAGKSTILSSILYSLQQTPGNLCTISDKTDYTESEEGASTVSLEDKHYEVKKFVNKGASQSFTVDTTPTQYKSVYKLKICCNNSAVSFDFIDVPGEWMNKKKPDYKTLIDEIKECDVFVVAIDTPYLMEASEPTNKYYNRVDDITNALSELVDAEYNPDRLLLLCPVKCEKWTNKGEYDYVTYRVKCVYKNLINIMLDIPKMKIWIMPLNTVGGIEFEQFLPAKIIRRDSSEPWKKGSIDELTKMIKFCDGTVARNSEEFEVSDDFEWTKMYSPADIPLSWYKSNGGGMNMKFCEQPGYHILKFLVEKEEEVIKEKAAAEKLYRDNNPIRGWLKHIFNPTFGQYLPIWKDLIDDLQKKELIKISGDGFKRVTDKIQ